MLVSIVAPVTRTAVQNSCERLDSSRSEKMATSPATSSTAMNSNGCWSMAAQISTMMVCAMKAVLESMKTRMKMGTMANGMI